MADRLLLVGHGASPTGFARVICSIADRCSRQYDTHVFAIETGLAPAPNKRLWSLHVNPSAPNIHDNSSLEHLLRELDPDLVLLLDQPWVAARRAPLLSNRKFRTAFYAAIESEDDFTPEIARALCRYDELVTFTHFGARIVRKFLQDPPVEVIPHGVDQNLFFPLAGDAVSSRSLARKLLFERSTASDERAFIVLNANRNQPFKRIDLTVEGFARFARDKPPNVLLYLHMGTRRSPAKTPLVDSFGIRGRVLSTTQSEMHPDISDNQLRLIYNACDVGINTSEGEGWGLVSFEHAATGAAQIMPRHTACEELWPGAAEFLNPVLHDSRKPYARAGRTVTAEGVSAALESLYSDPLKRQALSQAGYLNATRPEYLWNNIAEHWDNLFRRLLTRTSAQ